MLLRTLPSWRAVYSERECNYPVKFQRGCVVLPFQNSPDWLYFEQCTVIEENIDCNETVVWMYSFHICSLKQLHATLQGQVGNVTRWKWQCSSPKEQNEASGGVNNDSCLHSTLHLETAKAASDIHRQNLVYLLAKCSHLYSEMQWMLQRKRKSGAWLSVLGPGLKVHSLFCDSELYATYLILKLF